jgi:hypothetical protein
MPVVTGLAAPAFCPQAERMGLPLREEDRSDMVALTKAGIRVSWDGRRVVAPPGVVDEHGYVDLDKYKPQKKSS